MERKPDVNRTALTSVLRHVFGPSRPVHFERTSEGRSSQTYRLTRGGDVFYLRVAEEVGQDLRVDAKVHQRLRCLGVRVPDVIYVEPVVASLNRSVLIMSEIPGSPLGEADDAGEARHVAEAAGADAARFGEIAIRGFGWIDRTDAEAPLGAELPSYRDFVTSYMPHTTAKRRRLLKSLLAPHHIIQIEAMIAFESARVLDRSRLAHGDLDVTAIYSRGDAYTGIIDFSELRGAEPELDLGHFLLHDRETNPHSLYEWFLRGYVSTATFAVDEDAVRRSAVLSGLRQMCRWLDRLPDHPPTRRPVWRRASRLRELLEWRVE
jgi:aminoglycoside phosphotransferase (APT) family kinase protein